MVGSTSATPTSCPKKAPPELQRENQMVAAALAKSPSPNIDHPLMASYISVVDGHTSAVCQPKVAIVAGKSPPPALSEPSIAKASTSMQHIGRAPHAHPDEALEVRSAASATDVLSRRRGDEAGGDGDAEGAGTGDDSATHGTIFPRVRCGSLEAARDALRRSIDDLRCCCTTIDSCIEQRAEELLDVLIELREYEHPNEAARRQLPNPTVNV